MNFSEKIESITLKNINYDNLIKISIPTDMNCFFHSILRSFSETYIKSDNLTRLKITKNIRIKLSEHLEHIDKKTCLMIYDTLSNGTLREFSKNISEYSLDNMKNELKNNCPVDNAYVELASNVFDIDIYILNLTKGDIYLTGTDFNLYYKERDSIFIGYTEPEGGNLVGHFEVIGLKSNGIIQTFFKNDHSFVKYIRNKYKKFFSDKN
jgi:hypothetical protein